MTSSIDTDGDGFASISDLPAANELSGDELIELVQSGASRNAPLRALLALLGNPQTTSSAASIYTHVQDIPAMRWDVLHSLNCHPACSITDEHGEQVLGTVQHISKMALHIQFSIPISGSVRCL